MCCLALTENFQKHTDVIGLHGCVSIQNVPAELHQCGTQTARISIVKWITLEGNETCTVDNICSCLNIADGSYPVCLWME